LVSRSFTSTLLVTALLGAATAAPAAPLHNLALTRAHTDPLLLSSESCPAHDRYQIRSTRPGAATILVPRGAREVLLCRYSGVGPNRAKANRLRGHRLVWKQGTVAILAKLFDVLKQSTGPMACPNDPGEKIIAFFRYRSSAADPVTVDLGGCATVSNGHITRNAIGPDGSTLIRQLESLTRSR
jgi:hypothetical protein